MQFLMKQTKMYVCTLKNIYSSRCSHIAVHGWSEVKNAGLYTLATKEWDMWELLLDVQLTLEIE